MLSDFMKEIPSGHSTRGGCSLPDPTLYTHTHTHNTQWHHAAAHSQAVRNRK